MKQRGAVPLRRVLPIAQLLVCVMALWPSRYFLAFEVSQSVEAYIPAKAKRPSRPMNIEIPALIFEQMEVIDRSERILELRMQLPEALNLPVGLVQLPYVIVSPAKTEWAPRGMLIREWRSLSWPVAGIFFWWLAGRGIDALRAARRSIVAPRVTIAETVFATLLVVIGLAAIIGIITSTPDDRRDIGFLVLLAGGLIWGILASLALTARFMQWRIAKRIATIPVPA